MCRRFFERLIFLRAVVTRVSSASVTIDGAVTASIEKGFLVLVGIAPSDTPDHVRRLADKIIGLRIFEDENGKMNLNLASAGGSLLIVSQFTLYAGYQEPASRLHRRGPAGNGHTPIRTVYRNLPQRRFSYRNGEIRCGHEG